MCAGWCAAWELACVSPLLDPTTRVARIATSGRRRAWSVRNLSQTQVSLACTRARARKGAQEVARVPHGLPAYLRATDRYPNFQHIDQNLENKSFLKEVNAIMAQREASWDRPLFEHRGHYLFFDEFMEIRRRSKYFAISVQFSQRALRRRTFGLRFWERRSKAIRALDGVNKEDPSQRHSIAVVRGDWWGAGARAMGALGRRRRPGMRGRAGQGLAGQATLHCRGRG
jgi:hypothetical protein